jgi:two-component system KDP operon response regulator KdpE
MTRALIVDDEPAIRRALVANMRARGYDCDAAAGGNEALVLAAGRHPDVVVLDLGLPDIAGIEVIAGLRAWSTVPIVILSARDSEQDKVAALDAGADDYVTKPFGMDELFARVRAALRRHHPPPETPLVHTADFDVDLVNHTATRGGGADCRLTPTEWQIVSYLVRHPGQLVTQQQLLQHIWNTSIEFDTSLLRVHLVHIRRKLEPDPTRPRYFLTEPRMGYRFVPGD